MQRAIDGATTSTDPIDVGRRLLDARDYARIEHAIVYIAREFRQQPDLATLAAQVGLSEAHFNRLFRQWAGVTPKQLIQRLTLDAAKWQLDQAHSVMSAALNAGLSGPGRLHDLFITLEAMTPGEYKTGGVGLQLHYGQAATPFGPAWLAWCARGLCHLQFASAPVVVTQDAELLPVGDELDAQAVRQRWPNASWQRDDVAAAAQLQPLWWATQPQRQSLRLLVQGSNFQLQVWRALLQLGERTTDYGELARQIGRAKAARAVGNAVGANPLLYLIPCHHVLRANGGLGGYAGGVARKQVMLAWEYAQQCSKLNELP